MTAWDTSCNLYSVVAMKRLSPTVLDDLWPYLCYIHTITHSKFSLSKNYVSYPCLHVAWTAISALYGCNPTVVTMTALLQYVAQIISTDDDMLSGTYKITEDNNPHSDHNENLKSYTFFRGGRLK